MAAANGPGRMGAWRRSAAWLALAALLIASGAIAYWLRPQSGDAVVPARVAQVQRGTLAVDVVAAGVVVPDAERRIEARIGGIVEELRAHPGQRVSAGTAIARLRSRQARAAVVAARLDVLRARADARARGVRQLEDDAGVERRLLELRAAERLRAASTVTADAAGILRDVPIRPGDVLAPGDLVARIVDAQGLLAVARVPAPRAARLEVGRDADVTLLDRQVAGIVTRVAPAGAEGDAGEDGYIAVHIALARPLPPGARPDMAVRARIAARPLDDVLFVARPPHVVAPGAWPVLRADGDGRPAGRATVNFGIGTAAQVEVREGLAEGDALLLADPDDAGAAAPRDSRF